MNFLQQDKWVKFNQNTKSKEKFSNKAAYKKKEDPLRPDMVLIRRCIKAIPDLETIKCTPGSPNTPPSA